ncbi:MAG: hypothetical protein VX899_18320 [Myxococcota bacterium]|nr:hypothetical protein [Myxococcota bacterium]
MPFLTLLLACEQPLVQAPDPGSWTDLDLEVGVAGQPVGPHSTLYSDGDWSIRGPAGGTQEILTGPWQPELLDASGQPVALVNSPFTSHWEPYVQDTDHNDWAPRWIAPAGLTPGETYSFSSLFLDGDPAQPYPLDGELSFTVAELAPDTFSLEEGDVFRVEGYRLNVLDSILQAYGTSWLRIGQVTESQVRMELIIESDFRCRAVNAWVDRDGDSLRWQTQEIRLPYSQDIELVGQGIFVDLPLSADGDFIAGQASMTVQAAGFDALMAASNDDWQDGELCDLIAGFGASCFPCLEGEGECRHFYVSDLHAVALADAEAAAFDEDLPTCGVDASSLELPVIDLSGLDLDCGCTTAAGFSSASLGWLALALVRTRRRKKRKGGEDGKQA